MSTITLNSQGQVTLAGTAALTVNGAFHPLVTAKNLHFSGMPVTAKGLYNGFMAICAVDLVSFFVLYGANKELESYGPLAAAVGGGVASAPIIAVGEGFMANRQVHDLPYSQAIERAVRPAGLIATIGREVPFAVSVFWLAPFLQKKIESFFNCESSLWTQAAAGTVAGGLAGAATNPIDLLKTRVQVSPKNLSLYSEARAIFAQKGWRGFTDGIKMRVVSVGGMVAAMHLVNNVVPGYLPGSMHAKDV